MPSLALADATSQIGGSGLYRMPAAKASNPDPFGGDTVSLVIDPNGILADDQ
jgi:hypothetical protein